MDKTYFHVAAACTIALVGGVVAKQIFVAQKPSFRIATTTVDLGTLPLGGSIRELAVPISNEGDAELLIHTVATSCGCLTVALPDGPIPPGGIKSAVLRVDPNGDTVGPKTQKLILGTNDPSYPQVVINARWLVSSPQAVTWCPDSVTRELHASAVSDRNFTFLIFDSWSDNLSVFDVAATSMLTPPIVTELTYGCSDPSLPPIGHAFRVTTSLRPNISVGQHRELISLRTNHPEYAEIRIPINVTIPPTAWATPWKHIVKGREGLQVRKTIITSTDGMPIPDPLAELPEYPFIKVQWVRNSAMELSLTFTVDTDNITSDLRRIEVPAFPPSSGIDIKLTFIVL